MFIKYTINEQLILPAEEYTQSTSKAVRAHILAKYLFKIVTLNTGAGSIQVICIKVESIQLLDNIILRKTADMKVQVLLAITALRLLPNEYYEGVISELSQKGIKVKFINGLLEGMLTLEGLHQNTVYSEQKNQWILTTEGQGYEWKLGSKVRFRIKRTNFSEEEHGGKEDFSDMIELKADEAGLGPLEWWV